MKKKKRPSKGMRKHIRRQKVQKKKDDAKKEITKQTISRLPNYEDLPKRIKYYDQWQCPHCKKRQFYRVQLKKTIKTQQGPKVIFQCEYTNCNGLFRP